jgi:hypothetical protein
VSGCGSSYFFKQLHLKVSILQILPSVVFLSRDVPVDAGSGVARFCWRPGRVITMVVPNSDHEL